jgi:hypothetical protein
MNELKLRRFFREPIPEIYDAARFLNAAATAHLKNQKSHTEELIVMADMPAIASWTESIWGASSQYLQFRKAQASINEPSDCSRTLSRMPNASEKTALHLRDGFHCRFCGIPVIRKEIREILRKSYPLALRWGNRNVLQHAAFQAMWLQYDHIIPHAKGGTNDLDNLLITCAPCNFGRSSYTLEEVGLLNPLQFSPHKSSWDGLERIRITAR